MDGVVSTMNGPVRSLLFWLPRVLTILFALFLSIFSLDVFNEGLGFFKTIAALLIHLIPSFLVLLILIVAWRREWVAGAAYIFLSVLYLARGHFHWSAYAVISGPLMLIGLLFFLTWFYRANLHGT